MLAALIVWVFVGILRRVVIGHTLEDQVGGQADAGFYEDRDPAHPLARFLPAFAATRAVKPGAAQTA